jgi:uncharacterized DUF497 family protein
MKIIWDPKKSKKLKEERGIDLDEIKILIENKQYLDILENTSREGQLIVPLFYKNYIHIVAIKMSDDEIVIKTCYPSRKAHKKYYEDKL